MTQAKHRNSDLLLSERIAARDAASRGFFKEAINLNKKILEKLDNNVKDHSQEEYRTLKKVVWSVCRSLNYASFKYFKLDSQNLSDISSRLIARTHTKYLSLSDVQRIIQESLLYYGREQTDVVLRDEKLRSYLLDINNFKRLEEEHVYWDHVHIYQNMVKALRNGLHLEPNDYKKLSSYRNESSRLLKALGHRTAALDDAVSGDFYDVLATESQQEFDKSYKKLLTSLHVLWTESSVRERTKVEKRRAMDLASAWIHAINLADTRDFGSKLRAAKNANRYFSQARNARSYKYRTYILLFELMQDMVAAKDVSELRKRNYEVANTDFRIITDPNFEMLERRYNAVVKALSRAEETSDDAIVTAITMLENNGILSGGAMLKALIIVLDQVTGQDIHPLDLANVTTVDELQSLEKELAHSEITTIEVKGAIGNTEDVGKTISAFSNTLGGQIIFGLYEKDKVHQIEGLDSNAPEIADSYILQGILEDEQLDMRRQSFTRKLDDGLDNLDFGKVIKVRTRRVLGRLIIVLKVPANQKQLTSYRNIFYKRVDAQNIQMRHDKIKEFFMRQMAPTHQ